MEEAACRKALEEIGVRGHLQSMLGLCEYKKQIAARQGLPEGLSRAYIFAMEVTKQLETWLEQQSRCRKWVVVSDAIEQCSHEWMRGALEQLRATKNVT